MKLACWELDDDTYTQCRVISLGGHVEDDPCGKYSLVEGLIQVFSVCTVIWGR